MTPIEILKEYVTRARNEGPCPDEDWYEGYDTAMDEVLKWIEELTNAT